MQENSSKPRVYQIRNVSWKDQHTSEKWLLDSGASTHACNDASLFDTINPEDSVIVVGDDREIKVTGRGTVKLKLKANEVVNTLVLNDVALVPELGVNLVSTGRLENQGLKITAENGMSEISSFGELVGVAIRTVEHPFLYEMLIQKEERINLINSVKRSEKDWTLWHKRLDT